MHMGETPEVETKTILQALLDLHVATVPQPGEQVHVRHTLVKRQLAMAMADKQQVTIARVGGPDVDTLLNSRFGVPRDKFESALATTIMHEEPFTIVTPLEQVVQYLIPALFAAVNANASANVDKASVEKIEEYHKRKADWVCHVHFDHCYRHALEPLLLDECFVNMDAEAADKMRAYLCTEEAVTFQSSAMFSPPESRALYVISSVLICQKLSISLIHADSKTERLDLYSGADLELLESPITGNINAVPRGIVVGFTTKRYDVSAVVEPGPVSGSARISYDPNAVKLPFDVYRSPVLTVAEYYDDEDDTDTDTDADDPEEDSGYRSGAGKQSSGVRAAREEGRGQESRSRSTSNLSVPVLNDDAMLRNLLTRFSSAYDFLPI